MAKKTLPTSFLVPVFFLLTACSPGRAWESFLVLSDMAAADEESLLKKRTPDPGRVEIPFATGGEEYPADLYLPGEKIKAGLLLVPGAAPEGKEDPRLVSFARTLARARFSVLVPDIPSLREQQVHSGNIQDVAEALEWLTERPEFAPAGRVGIVALSYSAGPAILASMSHQLGDRVRFIMAVGGYYDLSEVLVFFTTGYFEVDGEWEFIEPNQYGKWVVVLSNLDRIRGEEDRRIFEEMARLKMENPETDVSELARQLGPEARPLHMFLTSRTPAEARKWMKKIPAGIQEEIAALDLANKDLSRLTARMILIHGYEDNIIPYRQSILLDRSLPEERSSLFLVHGLAHVDLEPKLMDRLKLWRAIYLLLSEREKIMENQSGEEVHD